MIVYQIDLTKTFRQNRLAADTAFERSFVSEALKSTNGNLTEAARAAKMDRKYLTELARKHGLLDRKKIRVVSLDSDAPAHQARDMTTVRVTSKELGVREITLPTKTAKFYISLWEKEGHKVEIL